MRLHVELRRAQLERTGMAAGEADRVARQRFGNPLRLREQSMDTLRLRWIEQLGRDVRVGARTLVKNPGFAAAAILTLALATGATTAIFSVVNGVVLRPLPFDEPERLVKINGRMWREDRTGEPDPMGGPLALPEFEAYRKSTSLEAIAGYEITTRLLSGSSGLERLTAASLDREAFAMLGVDAIEGRTFRPDDGDDVAVISARLWEDRFQRDRSIVGRVVTLDNRPFTIVGVMPARFQFPYGSGSLMQGTTPESRTDVWVPMGQPRLSAAAPVRRGRVQTVGRLRQRGNAGGSPGGTAGHRRAGRSASIAPGPPPRMSESTSRSSRSATSSLRRCGKRSGCCSPPSAWSSPRPAPAWRTCCSRA